MEQISECAEILVAVMDGDGPGRAEFRVVHWSSWVYGVQDGGHRYLDHGLRFGFTCLPSSSSAVTGAGRTWECTVD